MVSRNVVQRVHLLLQRLLRHDSLEVASTLACTAKRAALDHLALDTAQILELIRKHGLVQNLQELVLDEISVVLGFAAAAVPALQATGVELWEHDGPLLDLQCELQPLDLPHFGTSPGHGKSCSDCTRTRPESS